ncbi:SPFH domain-containing protein [Intestinibacter sp.]|uniref:SPFH domain-containing protein n=1 Tax=Intestinibacter sp. TaxID=1965304 RepID=UPI002A91C245|nr:SPFH domain-containing protein [Intestinibacter sp.]MDY5212746.1 SPFH domain-containing protein [Intestinibacter sp.]
MGENNFVKQESSIEEKELNPMSGWLALFLGILFILSPILGVIALIKIDNAIWLVATIILFIIGIFMLCGLKIVNPNESIVFVLFGKYYGTLKKPGFFFVNPFVNAINPTYESQVVKLSKVGDKDSEQESTTSTTKKISLKAMTLNNQKQKVNDELGNPIIIGTIVIWRVINPTKAVFNVENYKTFLSIQCDSTIRNVARLYPYDSEDTDDYREKSLRGSSQEIAGRLKEELQKRVEIAGIEVEEVRITHLSYAPEIAAAMLQRQQAEAIIAARKKIVEGAVGMVEMALNSLSEKEVVELDDERKAAMVSNLLVVLCGNKDAQPIVNSGSIY